MKYRREGVAMLLPVQTAAIQPIGFSRAAQIN